MLNAMIEESRRVARVNSGGCDVFRPVRHVDQLRPASPAPATTFANRGLLKAGASALGSLTVQRSTVAASAQSTGLITASSAPAPPSSDEQRDRTSDGPRMSCGWSASPCSPSRQRPRRVAGPAPCWSTGRRPRSGRSSCSSECPTRTSHRPVARNERVLLDLWAGSTGLLRVGIGQLGGKICLRGTVASGTGWVYSDLDLADGQWRKLTLWRYAANQVVASLQDSGGAVFTMAADMDAVDYVMIGGARNSTAADGKQNRVLRGDLAGFAAPDRRWRCLALPGARRADTRGRHGAGQRAGRLPESGIAGSVYYSGSSSQDVARTPMAGRSMLDCQREVARTIGGIIFAARDGNLVLARSDAYWRSTVGTYLMLATTTTCRSGTSSGTTAWTRRHPWCRRPGRAAPLRWPEPPPSRPAPSGTCRSRPRPSRMPRPSRRRALIPDAVSLCPRQISLDLVNTSTNRWACPSGCGLMR